MFIRCQACWREEVSCCTKSHQLIAVDATNPAATLVLGVQMCVAEAKVPAAGTAGEAVNQSTGLETDDSAQYEQTTYEHRRGIEADYHPVQCLARQPQVFIETYYTARDVE